MEDARAMILSNDALKQFFITDLYPKKFSISTILPYEACLILNDLSGSDKFDLCHSDMGIYGFDSPKKLIEYVLSFLKE